MLGQRPGKKSLTSIALKNVTYGLLITDVLFYYKNLILLINKRAGYDKKSIWNYVLEYGETVYL